MKSLSLLSLPERFADLPCSLGNPSRDYSLAASLSKFTEDIVISNKCGVKMCDGEGSKSKRYSFTSSLSGKTNVIRSADDLSCVSG